MNTITMFLRAISAIVVAGPPVAMAWDYRLNGADWSGQGMCGKGAPQSPIDLPTATIPAEDELTLFLKYPKLDSAVTVYNNGYSIALTLPESFRAGFGLGKGSEGAKAFSESEGAETYRLWQVNFHSPSEHTINGVRMPLEMQLMHQQATGGDGLAVIAVLFNAAPNAYGALLDGIIGERLPGSPWQEGSRKPGLDFAPVLSSSLYYTYEGSLTVPPCQQHVKYFVRQEPVLAAHDQLLEFAKVLEATSGPKGNYRILQPFAGRSVTLVGTVDLVNAPDMRVKVKEPQLEEERPQKSAIMQSACSSEYYDDAMENVGRARVGESQETLDAKTKFNSAGNDYEAAESAVGDTERNQAMYQRLYDNTPGVVEKIEMSWRLKTAKELHNAAKTNVPLRDQAYADAKEDLKLALLKDCAELSKKEAEAAKKAVLTTTRQPSMKRKSGPAWQYPEPHVKLPHGLAGSPFSNKEPEASEVVMSSKIAPNLHQPDVPPSGQTAVAVGKDASASRSGSPDTLMAFRLPITPKALGDASELVKSLAKVAHIPESRFKVKEIKKASVAKVHGTSSAFEALAQMKMKELPRRALRRVRM